MIRSKVYKEIKEKLERSFSGLAYIDMQKGQMKRAKDNYPIPLPACLVEIRPVSWSGTTGGQLGETEVSFYLYLDLVTDSFDGSEQFDETIELNDKLDELYEVMQGFDGEDFNSLIRVSDQTYEYGKNYICFKADYRTVLDHDDKEPKKAPRPAPKFQSN